MRAATAIRRKLTFSNVMSAFAVFLVLGTGTAYAAATITSADIVDRTIAQIDIKTNSLGTNVLKDNGVKSVDIRDGEVLSVDILDETIAATDLATNSVGFAEIQTDGVQASEIADNSIDSGEIVDFSLSNQDVGVLFAQVNANGTLANSSGSTASSRLGAGTYEVDFGRDIDACAYVVTQGEAGIGGAGGAITGATDRAGNVEAAFVTTRDAAGALVDTAFQLVVVC